MLASLRPNFSVASPSVKGCGAFLTLVPRRFAPRARPRPVRESGPEFTPQYLSTVLKPFRAKRPGDASTPAELPERRTVGKWTASPNVRLYGRFPALSSAHGARPASA